MCLMYNSIDTVQYANLPHRNVAESLIKTETPHLVLGERRMNDLNHQFKDL